MSSTQTVLVETPRALRNSTARLLLIATLILCIACQASQTSVAAVYTYTPIDGAHDQWLLGTHWSAPPVSAATTELTFVADNATVLGNSLTNTNTNDITGAFSLNILDLQGTGPASGAATININSSSTSNYLNFVSNSATTPVVNLNALAGAAGLTYNVKSNITLTDNTTFQGIGTAKFKFGGIISGNGGLTKSGTSTLILSGGNTYSGLTTISGGTISFANKALDTAGGIVFDGGTLQWSGTNTQDISDRIAPIASGKSAILDTNGNNISFAAGLSGLGGLTKIGPGVLTLAGANTYTGNTTISAGTLALQHTNTLRTCFENHFSVLASRLDIRVIMAT